MKNENLTHPRHTCSALPPLFKKREGGRLLAVVGGESEVK